MILDLFSLYEEAFKIIFSWRKIFTQISFTLILPLSFIFLSDIKISDVLFAEITQNQIQVHDDEIQDNSPESMKLCNHISLLWVYFWLFKIAYFTGLLLLSFLSNFAVVYTIACVYSGQEDEVTFKKVMGIIPKVWTKLAICFFHSSAAIFTWIMVTVLSNGATKAVKDLFNFYGVSVPNMMILLYISIIRQTTDLVSFKEEEDEIEIKSRVQLKGKGWFRLIIYLKMMISLIIIAEAFEAVVVHGYSVGLVNKVWWVIIFLSLLLMLILLGLVLQTVSFFCCKSSSHHESIHESTLLDPLHLNPADHQLPLKAEDA